MSDAQKKAAAAAALELVEDGMTLGLGTGTTAAHFVDMLGAKVRTGLSCRAIPTSQETLQRAEAAGIELIMPNETTPIDLAIDGADEIDSALCLIKGGGGALLREKIIAEAAARFVVIADASKVTAQLGAFALPVEIDQFCWALTVRRLRETLAENGYLSCDLTLRPGDGGPFLSDGGHYIVDCRLERIVNPASLDASLRALPGVIETGLFIGLTEMAIIGGPAGVEKRTLQRTN